MKKDLNSYNFIKFVKKNKKLNSVGRSINHIRKNILHPENRERKVSYGELNPDKTIYIIRTINPGVGLGSILTSVLEKLLYCDKKKYYPVIDLQNYDNVYLEAGNIGKENAWEYYFKQPSGISISEAYKSKNVILSDTAPIIERFHIDSEFYKNHKQFANIRQIFDKYIILNDDTQAYVNLYIEKMFVGKNNILGILVRGTDYVNRKPLGHPRQPSVDTVIADAKEAMKKYNCDAVYLSTEDENILNTFKLEFPEMIFLERKYVSSSDNSCVANIINESTSPRIAGLQYLCQICALCRCNYLILSKTTILPYVLLSGRYKEKFVYELGNYGQ